MKRLIKISIRSLREKYENLIAKDEKVLKPFYKSFNYLNLSVHFNMDPSSFDLNNYRLLRSIFKSNPHLRSKEQHIENSSFADYLRSFKETRYIFSEKLNSSRCALNETNFF